MHYQNRFHVGAFTLLTILVAIGLSGCQSIDTEMGQLLGDTRALPSETVPAPTGDGPKIAVELRGEKQKPVTVNLAMPEPTYVQQALEQSGATRRFRRMKIEIYRQLPNGGGHKIPVAYDRSQRRVPSDSDYFLHPNDRIVVTEDTTNAIDDVLNSVAGPMNEMIKG